MCVSSNHIVNITPLISIVSSPSRAASSSIFVGESGGVSFMTEEDNSHLRRNHSRHHHHEEAVAKNDYRPHLHDLHRIRRQKKRGKYW